MKELNKDTDWRYKLKFLAEVYQDGKYLDIISDITKEIELAEKRVEEAKNQAYWERNQLVAALSKLFPSWLGYHSGKDWEDDWRTIVFIKIPIKKKVVSGDEHNYVPEKDWFKTVELQLSWHIHDGDKKYFTHLDPGLEEWDRHTTEEKYKRLAALKTH